MKVPKSDFNHLWNDLPFDERKRLMPHMLESQRLHIWQCQQKAIVAHNSHMKELNEIIKTLTSEIEKYSKEVKANEEKKKND